MKIRTKLALILSGGIATAAVVSALVFMRMQTVQITNAEEAKTVVLVDSVRQMAGEAQLANDPLMLLDYLEFLRDGREDVYHCRVLMGDRWQDVGGKAIQDPPGGTTVRVVEIPTKNAATRSAVEIHFLSRLLEERKQKALKAGFLQVGEAGGAVFLIGLLISFFVARSMTRRLVVIEETVEAVAEGKLGQVAEAGGHDEIARLARGVNMMSEKLREVEQMKKTFIASVTHELRSPLGAIDAQAKQMLNSGAERPETDRGNLERIRKNANRLEHFVTNLLEMSKIERGKLDFRPRRGEIGPLVEDTALFFAPRAKEAGLTLDHSVIGELPPMRLDADLISQVLTNFVSNAIKFTRKGGRITVSAHRDENGNGPNIECAVTDTGVGIPEEALKRVFSPFERVRNPLRATGAGLGLAISKSIIEMHGGTVGVSSELKKGSRFYFRIPIEKGKIA